MFAHRYAGTGPTSSVTPTGIRRHLVHSGYACAASSYGANYYHVRAGVGVADTNALALALNAVAAQNARPLAAPVRTYITGRSMGGHIAAAAVEAETLATAVNKYHYHAALPMCGVMADVELFNRFVGMQAAAQALAGVPDQPFGSWTNVQAQVSSSLFTSFSTADLPTTSIITTAKDAQLGDLCVPFATQQIYARRAATNGSSALLVQCAQCGAAQCDFTVAGQVESFEALAAWEQGGTMLPGDDVLTATVVSATSYGCRFTNNMTGPDDVQSTVNLRAMIAASTPACPAAAN